MTTLALTLQVAQLKLLVLRLLAGRALARLVRRVIERMVPAG